MNNKSKDLVVLQWLVISLNEEMNEIHNTWQSSMAEGNFAEQAMRFHAIGNVMTVANLGLFGQLAYLLERACRAFDEGTLPTNLAPKVFYASKLLYAEINRHILMGVDEKLLTDLRIRYMQELLHTVDGTHSTLADVAVDKGFSQRVVIGEHKQMTLSPDDHKKLAAAWRHASQKLLTANQNSNETLQMLAKAAHYAMMSAKTHTTKALWKVANLWVSSLALNNFPLPRQYGYLLSELDRVLALGDNDDSLDAVIWLENLLIDLYIQLGGLNVQSEETHEFLSSLSYRLSSEALFFPHILGMLEGMLFALSRGERIDGVLQEVKEQLGGRGWTFYESYAEQILNDLNLSKDNPEAFAQMQWQINTQIQDLYAAILHTHESIQSKIGEGVATKSVDAGEMSSELRRVRLLVETVKNSFNDYLHKKDPSVLANAEVFDELDTVFGDMAMYDVAKIVGTLNQLFAAVQMTPPAKISWSFAHSTAECLSLLELFLDGLVKQVFDNALLVKAKESADKAANALHDDTDGEFRLHATSTSDVVRYADTGVVIPQIEPSTPTTAEPDAPSMTAKTPVSKPMDMDAKPVAEPEPDVIVSAMPSEVLPVAEPVSETDLVQAFADDDSIVIGDDAFDEFEGTEVATPALAQNEPSLGDETGVVIQENITQDDNIQASDDVVDTTTLDEFVQEADDFIDVDDDFVQDNAIQENAVNALAQDDFIVEADNFIDVQEDDVVQDSLIQKNVIDAQHNLVAEVVQDSIIVETDNGVDVQDDIVVDVQDDIVVDGVVTEVGQNDIVQNVVESDVTPVSQDVINELIDDDIVEVEAQEQITPDDLVQDKVHTEPVQDIIAQESISAQDIPIVEVSVQDRPVEQASLIVPSAPIATTTPSEAYLEAKSALKPDDFDFDEDIREIFVEEADEVLETLGDLMPSWQANPTNLVPLKDIRRGFHTLKGSGRMVGAFSVGEMAWAVENMLNRVLDGTVPSNHTVSDFVAETATLIPTLVQDFSNKVPPSIDPANVVLKANNILAGRAIDDGVFFGAVVDEPKDGLVQEIVPEVAIPVETQVNLVQASPIDTPADELMAEPVQEELVQEELVQTNTQDNLFQDDVVNEPVADEFIQETPVDELVAEPIQEPAHIEDIHTKISDVVADVFDEEESEFDSYDAEFNQYLPDEFIDDDVSTLTDIVPSVAEPVQEELVQEELVQEELVQEELVQTNTQDNLFQDDVVNEPVADEFIQETPVDELVAEPIQEPAHIEDQFVQEKTDSLVQGVQELSQDTLVQDKPQDKAGDPTQGIQVADGVVAGASLTLPAVLIPFMETARQPVASQVDAVDDDIKEIFIEEASEVLETIIPLFKEWQTSRDKATLTDIRRGFHTLKGSGRMVGAVTLGELAWSIENMLNRVLDGTVETDDGMIALIGDVLDSFGGLVKRFEANDDTYPDELYLWVASAHAYSKGHGKEFDYQALKANDPAVKVQATSETKASTDSDKLEISLESIEEVAQSLATAKLIAPTSEEEQMLCGVFVDEAKNLLTIVKEFLDEHQGKDSVPVPDPVVRVFHTLRSATGLPPLARVGEMGAMIERGLQHFQRHDESLNEHHLQSLASSVDVIEQHLTAYENIIEGNTELANEQLSKAQSDHSLVDDLVGDDSEHDFDVSSLIEGIDNLLDAELELEGVSGQTPEVVRTYAEQILAEIEILDARTATMPKFQRLLLTLGASYQVLAHHPEQGQNDEFIDGILSAQTELTGLFDSMAGSMSLKLDERALAVLDAKIQDIQEYYRALDDHSLVQKGQDEEVKQADTSDIQTPSQETSPQDSTAGDDKANDTPDGQDDTANPSTSQETNEQAPEIARFQEINTEPELLEIFLEEAAELDTAIGESFGAWRDDTSNLDALKALQRHLHTVKGGARLAGISSIGDLTHEAETIYERMVDGRLTPSDGWVQVMQGVQDLLSLQLEEVKTNKRSFFADGAVAKLQKFLELGDVPAGERIAPPVFESQETPATPEPTPTPVVEEVKTELSEFEHRQLRSWQGNLPDEAILTVFLEEAEELVESSSEDFQVFRSNTGDVATLQVLQRKLHTIKGGARMVTATGLADLAHNMETVYEDLANRRRPATRMVIQLLMACHDFMAGAIVLLKSKLNPPTPLALISALEGFSKNPDSLTEVPVVSLSEELEAIKAHELAEKQSRGGRDISRMPPAMGMFELAEETTANNEMIRISANLMERMINLSGEAAINRARIDMTVSGLTSSVEEMGVTVQRLHDQLRRMDIELEAQIMAQIDDKTLFEDGDFDPLEMDQYSSLNQLSKSLSESASDLLDLKATLLEKTRDGENLLLQLSRTQTELQDSLMYSRMVPFSRLTPRLQRIVRQVSTELGKQVELTVVNADDEMDRTILERITSPLEHMLRNAIDHGVEMPDVRESLGKPRTGTIVLEVVREGSEILVHLQDDGAGINVEAVRKKAVSQGLIAEDDTSLSDLDIMQYIFNAGLSTTSVVTQISGRGVGMDVVRSEIRQLGGSVSVDSERGKGSKFTMRVPLTVAVSDTLVVRAADRQYAVPLVQIERVTQVPTAQLIDYYRSTNATMLIDGVPHRLRYLNEILSGHNLNDMAVSTQTLPVILIKNQTGQNLALQVDEIIGSRIEVVVKPLGRQLSHVSGISAATIMGDGSVMFILDLMALIRNARARVVVAEAPKEENKRPVILVVDDSVTVRKVTSRFLERQGFEAVVAKDGIDALEILQELTPDLMLLDIEMPRMDGFEVATQVRHNARLKDLPIIMITSRTGEKHRERAFEIGVTDYMGKPFQENELLSRISTHIS